jgi:Na+/melibiose symporter-like transporter
MVGLEEQSAKLATRTKLCHGAGDVGNAMASSAVQLFLMVFCTSDALIAPATTASR